MKYFLVPVRTNGDKCNRLQIELHECEWKNKAIPFTPKLPSPYSEPKICLHYIYNGI